MKTKIALLLVIPIIICGRLVGQGDPKWKDVSNIQMCNFQVNISDPDTECNEGARWDYFIIYEDGSYSTTRTVFQNQNDYSYTSNNIEPIRESYFSSKCIGTTNSEQVLKFSDPIYQNKYSITPGKKIKFFYITNIYDDEEPPALATITNTNDPGLHFPINEHAEWLNFKNMFVQHDVVANDDITIAINYNRLDSQNTLHFPNCFLPTNFPGQSEFIYSGENNLVNNITLIPDPLNANGSILNFDRPNKPTKNIFINLRASSTSNIYNYDEVAFQLNKGNIGFSSMIREKVLTAHDPNFIKLIDLCKPSKNCPATAKYLINFQNNGDASTSNISVFINFNENSFGNITNIEHRGCDNNPESEIIQSSPSSNGHKITFKFKDVTCIACKDVIRTKSQGQLILTVELADDFTDVSEILKMMPSEAYVTMENKKEDLTWMSDYVVNTDSLDNYKVIQACKCNIEGDGGPSITLLLLLGLFIAFILYVFYKKKIN